MPVAYSGESSSSLGNPLVPATIVYHESARSIVFRHDCLRQQQQQQKQLRKSSTGGLDSASLATDGQGLPNATVRDNGDVGPAIEPLEPMALNPGDTFHALGEPLEDQLSNKSSSNWRERTVVELLREERAVVKTVKASEWTKFLGRLKTRGQPFRTSTSLLPSLGKGMKCYGGKGFSSGVVFALPTFGSVAEEDRSASETDTWAWPSGYAAKTEFNIDSRGRLINGREQALVPISTLRKNNQTFLQDNDQAAERRQERSSSPKSVPFNEIYVRVGGCKVPEVEGETSSRGEACLPPKRSFDGGIGAPVALFVRSPTFADLVSLLRTRTRMASTLGMKYFADIPLLLITPEDGVKVLTKTMQMDLFLALARNLNPFQNPLLYKTTIEQTDEAHMRQKVEELLHLDDDIRRTLTKEECARLAGGYGATDHSVAQVLIDAMHQDQKDETKVLHEPENEGQRRQSLQDVVNEGLVSAVRAADYNTARQLLILYTLVATKGMREQATGLLCDRRERKNRPTVTRHQSNVTEYSSRQMTSICQLGNAISMHGRAPPPSPPPPLDTDRLRRATTSDGLLAVLGAAEVLKSIQNGDAKRRLLESVDAVEEWVTNGKRSVAYRLQSWRNQRVAQGDLKIAMKSDSHLSAFVGTHAITNRKNFAKQLRKAASDVDVESLTFLQSIHETTKQLHSPCLRLELLQYILGLDNRYSVAHVARSVELAGTCLNISLWAGQERMIEGLIQDDHDGRSSPEEDGPIIPMNSTGGLRMLCRSFTRATSFIPN